MFVSAPKSTSCIGTMLVRLLIAVSGVFTGGGKYSWNRQGVQNTMDYTGCRSKARILVYYEPGGNLIL